MDTAACRGSIATDRAVLDGERTVVIHTAADWRRIATDRAVRDGKRAIVNGSSSPTRSVALDGDPGERGVGVVEYTAAALGFVVGVATRKRQAAEADRARCDLQHPRRAARVDLELIRTRAGDGEILADRKLTKREV